MGPGPDNYMLVVFWKHLDPGICWRILTSELQMQLDANNRKLIRILRWVFITVWHTRPIHENVILCVSRCVCWEPHLLRGVLFWLDPFDDLLVDELGADRVCSAVVPRCEQFFTERESPGAFALLPALPPHFLLALRHAVHHVTPTAAQRPHLE